MSLYACDVERRFVDQIRVELADTARCAVGWQHSENGNAQCLTVYLIDGYGVDSTYGWGKGKGENVSKNLVLKNGWRIFNSIWDHPRPRATLESLGHHFDARMVFGSSLAHRRHWRAVLNGTHLNRMHWARKPRGVVVCKNAQCDYRAMGWRCFRAHPTRNWSGCDVR